MIRANQIDSSTCRTHFGLQQAPGMAFDLLITYLSRVYKMRGPENLVSNSRELGEAVAVPSVTYTSHRSFRYSR